jgi:predicted nuclease of restriction endonuclease-like (RecB) superfamily
MIENGNSSIINSGEYQDTIIEIKDLVYNTQHKTLKRINSELILMYWNIGKIIVERQEKQKWGDSVVEHIAKELRSEFKGKGDFSKRNVFRMRLVFLTYRDFPKVLQLVALLGWGHNDVILKRCKNPLEREFYIRSTISNSWSRSTLEEKIKNKEYESWAISQNNFDKTLTTKTQYPTNLIHRDQIDLSFLDLEDNHKEFQLEEAIVNNIMKFLSEMGGEFAFIGRQYEIELTEKIYKIDLLFFHRVLNCLVAVELKVDSFKPEYIGKVNAYLAALDKYVKRDHESPSIGILLCRSKNREEVELSLQFITKPIGVSSYQIYKNRNELPKNIEKHMPTIENIKRKLINLD